MHEPWFQQHPAFTLKGTVAGGMALVPAVAERWEAMTKTPIYQGYGLTETSPVVSLVPFHRNKRESIGVPVPGTDVRLVDAEGRDVAPGAARRAAGPRPAGDAGLLAAARRDRAGAEGRLAGHRRRRHHRRGGLHLHRRSQEGHDSGQRLQRVSERSRGRARRASRRGRGGGHRHARRERRRGGVRVRRPQGPGAHRRPTCAITAASRSPPTRCRGSSTSAPTCRSRRWARCCARTCGTWPRRRADPGASRHDGSGLSFARRPHDGPGGSRAAHAARPADAGARGQRARHRRGHDGHDRRVDVLPARLDARADRDGRVAAGVTGLVLAWDRLVRRRRAPGAPPAKARRPCWAGRPRHAVASAARLHEQLRHPAADAVLGHLVLRRRALHRRPVALRHPRRRRAAGRSGAGGGPTAARRSARRALAARGRVHRARCS